MLADAIRATLPTLRTQAESRMTSRATVRRKTGGTVTLPNGRQADAWADVLTELPCRLDGSSTGDGGSRTVNISGVEYQQATGVAHFPADTIDLADSDFFEVTSGEWVGSVYRIVEAARKDQATARRVPIAEESQPEGWA